MIQWCGRGELSYLVLVRALGLKKLEDRVVASIHSRCSNHKAATKVLKKLEDRVAASVHSSNNKKAATKVDEEAGGRSRVDMVAVVLVDLHVVEWPLNNHMVEWPLNSHMVDNLNTISRAGGLSSINEAEDHPSNMVA